MPYTKNHKKSKSANTDPGIQDDAISGVKPLVDHAIDRARNMDFQAAKEAIRKAKKQLDH